MVMQFTDNNFSDEVLKAKEPVLVDFWADWCGPCRMIAPIVEELSKEYSGKVKVGKVNVDENPSTSSKFGIRSIPTLILFSEGKVLVQVIGVQPKEVIKRKIDLVIT